MPVAAMRNEILPQPGARLQVPGVRHVKRCEVRLRLTRNRFGHIRSLGPYASFTGPHLITALLVLRLIAWIVNAYRHQRRLFVSSRERCVRRSGRSAKGAVR